MSYITYILLSPQHDKFYIGHMTDLVSRMQRHNVESQNGYTAKYRPWEVFATLEFSSRSMAMMAENYLKKKPREFIQRLSSDDDLRQYILHRFEIYV